MINSASDGGELNCLNSVGVRVSSKVKIPLKNNNSVLVIHFKN